MQHTYLVHAIVGVEVVAHNEQEAKEKAAAAVFDVEHAYYLDALEVFA